MDIPEREAIEARLANKLARLGAAQRRELMDYLGIPPDFSRVPQAYWDKVGLDLRGVLSAEIVELYLDAAERLDIATPGGVDWGMINQNAVSWAREYSYSLVRGITDTTRRAISDAVSDFFTLGQTRADLEARLVRLFGPVRTEMIAITEVTRASVEGERAVARDLASQGVHMIPYWLTRNDELVCPICGPKHDQPITDDKYPPAHPRCRCDVRYELP